MPRKDSTSSLLTSVADAHMESVVSRWGNWKMKSTRFPKVNWQKIRWGRVDHSSPTWFFCTYGIYKFLSSWNLQVPLLPSLPPVISSLLNWHLSTFKVRPASSSRLNTKFCERVFSMSSRRSELHRRNISHPQVLPPDCTWPSGRLMPLRPTEMAFWETWKTPWELCRP